MIDSPADKLRKARIARGYATAADAARAHGWSLVTYTSHENGTRGLRPDAAVRYARAYGLSEADLLGLRPTPSVTDVPVIGVIALGIWRDMALDSEQKTNRNSAIVISAVGAGVQFAFEVLDNSVNKLICMGEFAICAPVNDDDVTRLGVGSVVVVERVRGSLKERSIRRVEANHDRLRLQTYSTDKKLTETVEMPSRRKDEVVKIVGCVVGKYARLSA